MITDNTLKYIEEILSLSLKEELRILSFKALSGGDINEAYLLETSPKNFFIKINSASKYPKMFSQEAFGLDLLREANGLRIPGFIAEGIFEDTFFLILDYISSVKKNDNFWEAFARGLSTIHKKSSNNFGLEDENYIGSLKQYNARKSDWVSFFIEERLLRQLKLAHDSKLADSNVLSAFDRLFGVLNEIIPEEVPSLLHGDLWSGNFMVDDLGEACLIDPAVYYGHREMDIAMTKLFGGFSEEFYSHYNNYFPLEKGWENRIEICNLYPLLVHLNLFGSSYLHQIKSILRRF